MSTPTRSDRRERFLRLGVAAVLAAGAVATAVAGAPRGGGCGDFVVVASPNQNEEANFLMGLAVAGPESAWAVGRHRVGSDEHPLGLRWDGTSWSLVAMPMPPHGNQIHVHLQDAHAFGPDDVWAVGDFLPPDNGLAVETLAMHWDGEGWAIVPSWQAEPEGVNGSAFRTIGGAASDDAWAVGYTEVASGAARFLAVHWDGSGWDAVHILDPINADFHSFVDLHVIASDDIYALAGYGSNSPDNPVLFHWDGSSWSSFAAPLDPFRYSGAFDLIAFAADDVWIQSGAGLPLSYIMLHWDGASWTEHAVPDQYHQANFVGTTPDELHSIGHETILRWNGATWETAATLDNAFLAGFFDADLMPGGAIWGVGRTEAGADARTLTARYDLCSEIPADTDGNGTVDVDDLINVILDWATTGTANNGDVNGSGLVDVDDLVAVILAWGRC